MVKESGYKDPKEAFPNSRDRIVYAFSIGETDYYEFSDLNSVPCERGFYALAFYRELSMCVDRDYLKLHTKAVDDIINNSSGIKLTEIVKLNQQLKERNEWLFHPDIAYKLCSVVYFDATENPYQFEFKHANEKAVKFQQEKMESFFLQKPIVRLIPYLAQFGNDLTDYLEAVNRMTHKHLENISTMLSETSKNNEFYKYLGSLRPLASDEMWSKISHYTSTTSTSSS